MKEAHQQSSIFTLQFDVQDTGMGIAPNEMEKIFDPFVQKRSDKTSSEGTGLGLAISRKLVRMMDGDIAVKSEVGKGSVFSFEILVDPGTKVKIETEKHARRVTGLVPGQSAYGILVVEDNPENRTLLCKLLLSVGFEVYEAVNGQEAIDQYKRLQPDLIWMDMAMPVIDGYEATKRIRELEIQNAEDRTSNIQLQVSSHIPIIALTAHAFEEEKEVILAAGCDDLVRKPFQEAEIFETMPRYLGIRYVYEEEKEHGARGKGLTPEALAQLPDDLRKELKQAIIDLKNLIKKILKYLNLWNEESSRDPPVPPEIPNEIAYVPIDDGWSHPSSDFIG